MPRVKMEKTDGLSKRLDWKMKIENDNENQKVNKRKMDMKNSGSGDRRTRRRIESYKVNIVYSDFIFIYKLSRAIAASLIEINNLKF